MTQKPSIADQIAALEVHIPSASSYQKAVVDMQTSRSQRRSTPRHNVKRPGRQESAHSKRCAERLRDLAGDAPDLPLPVELDYPNDATRCRIILGVILKAAEAGERCPTAPEFALHFDITSSPQLIGRMAAAGILRVEVGGRNYRAVWICAGPHRGKHTKPPANPSRPYHSMGPDRPTLP